MSVSRKVHDMPSVTLGLLSTAAVNRFILGGARESKAIAVAAVASRDEDRARAYARVRGIERSYGSYEALLEDSEIEAVYVPLPNQLHVEWSVRALEAGKHVLCEKPFGRRARDVDRAFAVAATKGLVLMEAFMYRHDPQTTRVCELVAGGLLGDLRLIRSVFSIGLTDPTGDVRTKRDLDGGALMDLGCYCVDFTRLLAGEPTEVYGDQVLGVGGVDERFTGIMRHPGDIVGIFDCGLTLPERSELEVVGEDASLLVQDPWHSRPARIRVRRTGEDEEILVEQVNPYGLQLDNFADAVRGRATPLLGRNDAVFQSRAIEALYRSASERMPVPVRHS